MGKYVITRFKYKEKDILFYGIKNESGFYRISLDTPDNSDLIGNVYVGYVKDIVKNIDAAFIEYQDGKTGYFSINDNKNPVFLNKKNTDKICQGDLVLVQISKNAIKTKFPVLTSKISLTGKYCVLNYNKTGIGFSGKIKDQNFKSEVRDKLSNLLKDDRYSFGVIIRTNATTARLVDIESEITELKQKMTEILSKSEYRTKYSILHNEPKDYLTWIKGFYKNEVSEIVTDNRDLYENISDYMEKTNIEISLNLYEDDLLPLYKLHSIEKTLNDTLNKKVWLKSGAYLYIEQTEAMVVIDVNTGKCIKGNNSKKHILNVNIEAAKEIALQLSLRNLSGIIIIDFINMSSEEDKVILIDKVKEYILKDKIKTDYIEMTKLDLVELTRKKTKASLVEQYEKVIN